MSRSRRVYTTAAAALAGLGFFLWVWLEPGGPRLAMAFSDLATVGVCLLAAAACLRAGRLSMGRRTCC